MAITVVLLSAGQLIFGYVSNMITRYLEIKGSFLTAGNMDALVLMALGDYFLLMSPIFLTAVLAGLAINYLQVGFLFTTESLNPQLNRLNPAEGFKKIVSKKAIFELVKSILKVALVGLVAFLFVRGQVETLLLTLYQDVSGVWKTLSSLALSLSLRIAVVFLSLSVLDYIYQRYEHNQNLKMSKQEVKEEFKQMEGDPQLKARLRERQRKMAMQRMMQDVPNATVVITNPTRLAVALRYQDGTDQAPIVVAKGAELIAKRIRDLAGEHDVPIIENKFVARMLYDQVEIGQEIPVELYQAVAEILAIVYRIKN